MTKRVMPDLIGHLHSDIGFELANGDATAAIRQLKADIGM